MLSRAGSVRLSYCTNIFACKDLTDLYDQLSDTSFHIRRSFADDSRVPLGLWFSKSLLDEVKEGAALDYLKSFLESKGIEVTHLNGFPYGAFHGTKVKEGAYVPDWSSSKRVDYTVSLASLLKELLKGGDGAHGGISTVPISYKGFYKESGETDSVMEEAARKLAYVALRLKEFSQECGSLLHIDIEPEPDCILENSDDLISFYNNYLLRAGLLELIATTGLSAGEAEEIIREHIRVCFDICHFSTIFESPIAAANSLRAEGIEIGRVQLSSALEASFNDRERRRSAGALKELLDDTYLHQCRLLFDDGSVRAFKDMDGFLKESPQGDFTLRSHYHMPLYFEGEAPLQTTAFESREFFEYALATGLTDYFEVETYTYDILPPSIKSTVMESITRELLWCRSVMEGVVVV